MLWQNLKCWWTILNKGQLSKIYEFFLLPSLGNISQKAWKNKPLNNTFASAQWDKFWNLPFTNSKSQGKWEVWCQKSEQCLKNWKTELWVQSCKKTQTSLYDWKWNNNFWIITLEISNIKSSWSVTNRCIGNYRSLLTNARRHNVTVTTGEVFEMEINEEIQNREPASHCI